MVYNHFLSVHLETPVEVPKTVLESLVREYIGKQFVKSVSVNISNEKAPTTSEMDPLSDEYVGHNIARRYGVKCCCDRSVIECPYHGR
jgi:hypothetical protein